MDQTILDALNESKVLLNQLQSVITAQEAHLGSDDDEPQSESYKAIEALNQTRLYFADPADRVQLLDTTNLDLQNIPEGSYNPATHQLYLMPVPAIFRASQNVFITEATCELKFTAPPKVTVQSLAPKPDWADIISWGGEAEIGIGTDLGIEFSLPDTVANGINVPLKVKEISAKARAKTFIKLLPFEFSLGGTNRIQASGIQTDTAFWRIRTREIRKQNTLPFTVVFKTEKQVKQIQLEGMIYVKLNKQWLRQALRHIWSLLTIQVQDELEDDDKSLLIGEPGSWAIDLPNTAENV